jgi:lipopolysaccharide export LptBFGC system permease protein LptF
MDKTSLLVIALFLFVLSVGTGFARGGLLSGIVTGIALVVGVIILKVFADMYPIGKN